MAATTEKDRYTRQLVLPQIGGAGQAALESARVLVIGLGGLGCPAAQYLAAAGIGHLGIVDHDKVEYSNLHRQLLYTADDIGEAKVRVASPRLHALGPHMQIESYGERFMQDNAIDIAKKYDLILDCTDNFTARYAINAYATEFKKPHIFASLYRFEGTLTVFDSRADAGCYRCLYPDSSEAMQNCSEAGVIGALPGIMGAMQALEAIKIITGAGDVLNTQVLVYDGLTQTMRKFSRAKNLGCPVCMAEGSARD
jgi:molybdopterin/thiamine biosynthesis adenylyltransferase